MSRINGVEGRKFPVSLWRKGLTAAASYAAPCCVRRVAWVAVAARTRAAAGPACREHASAPGRAATAESGRARLFRGAARPGSLCRHRRVPALCQYDAQPKRWRYRTANPGPSPHRAGAVDRLVQGLRPPGRTQCGRASRSPRLRYDRHRLGCAATVPGLRRAIGGLRRQRRISIGSAGFSSSSSSRDIGN